MERGIATKYQPKNLNILASCPQIFVTFMRNMDTDNIEYISTY